MSVIITTICISLFELCELIVIGQLQVFLISCKAQSQTHTPQLRRSFDIWTHWFLLAPLQNPISLARKLFLGNSKGYNYLQYLRVSEEWWSWVLRRQLASFLLQETQVRFPSRARSRLVASGHRVSALVVWQAGGLCHIAKQRHSVSATTVIELVLLCKMYSWMLVLWRRPSTITSLTRFLPVHNWF